MPLLRTLRPAGRLAPALALIGCLGSARADAPLPKVAEGFEVRAVATFPAVAYPCQVATAPDGALFVAEDPMDQVKPTKALDGRILRFRDGRGEPTVFADGLRAVFGMAWRDGALYVSHSPFLSVFRDDDGDGKAESRRDIFRDLGLVGDDYGLNDHIVSGLRFGMDGDLYISVGDKGIPKATGPDGRSIQLRGGGTVRCRPDGTGLEVVSTGTRNHLDANLDASDNIFTYDNTDDGLGWWTRVTHHVDGGYYGYPFDYVARPDRMLPRMAEYGGGSPCGAVAYLDDAWPERFQGRLLWAEWGKRQVRAFRFEPEGASFKVVDVVELAEAGPLESFRPIDLALSHDGTTLYVADWALGGWHEKNAKVGRVFAITPTVPAADRRPRGLDSDPITDQHAQLNHPAFTERIRAQNALAARAKVDPTTPGFLERRLLDPTLDPVAGRHLVWALNAAVGGTIEASLPLIEALKAPAADVRAQAARALGRRAVPIADEALAALVRDDPSPVVRLQAIIALGRIGKADAAPALVARLADADIFIAHSAGSALRRIGAWSATAEGLNSSDPAIRAGSIRTLERAYDPEAASALARFAADPARPGVERASALAALAEGRLQAPPWDGKWWGTQPRKRTELDARTVAWASTTAIEAATRVGLDDPDEAVRLAAVAATQVSADRSARPILVARLASDPSGAVRVAIAEALGASGDPGSIPPLVATWRDPLAVPALRDAALAAVEAIGGPPASASLVSLLADAEPDDRPKLFATAGRLKATAAAPILLAALESPTPTVRAAAAVEALGKLGRVDGSPERLRPLLNDADPGVRSATIAALATLGDRESIPALVALFEAGPTRRDAGLALAKLPDARATRIYLHGLADPNPEIRKASAAALGQVRDAAAPILDQLAGRGELPASVLGELRKIFAGARPITGWNVLGPFPIGTPPPFAVDRPFDPNAGVLGPDGMVRSWKAARTNGRGMVDLGRVLGPSDQAVAFAVAEVDSPTARPARLALGSDDTLEVWLNGEVVHRFDGSRGYEPEQSTVEVRLVAGANRLVIACGNHSAFWQFGVAASAPSGHAFLDGPAPGAPDPAKFRAAAQAGRGDPGRGRAIFEDPQGVGCMKCHAVGGVGGAVGPDLTGLAAKYPRDEVIAAVLEPSAKIASGYEPVVVALTDGRVVTGIVKAEADATLSLDDAGAGRVEILKDQIEERRPAGVSLMPAGLADGLGPDAFADLIAYLETLNEAALTPRPAGAP